MKLKVILVWCVAAGSLFAGTNARNVAANTSDEAVTAFIEMPDGAAIEHTFEKYGYLVGHSGEW